MVVTEAFYSSYPEQGVPCRDWEVSEDSYALARNGLVHTHPHRTWG